MSRRYNRWRNATNTNRTGEIMTTIVERNEYYGWLIVYSSVAKKWTAYKDGDLLYGEYEADVIDQIKVRMKPKAKKKTRSSLR